MRHAKGRGPRDRGVTVVETVVVAPLLITLIFAIIEGGLAFGDYLALANSTRAGARTASASGNDGLADFHILSAIAEGSTAIPDSSIERIVVFRATSPDATVPSACTTASAGVTGQCNVYFTSDFDRDEEDFGCSLDPPAPDRYWCPADRKVAETGTNGPPDYVGVWMKVHHPLLTGLFGTTLTFDDQTVMRIEPRRSS